MKNTVKLGGIIALAAVIGFGMVSCGGDDGDGGGGSGGAKLEPDSLSVSDAQVYTVKEEVTATSYKIVFDKYTGNNLTVTDEYGLSTGNITNGEFTYTINGAPSSSKLSKITDLFYVEDGDNYNFTVTPNDAKGVIIREFETSGDNYLWRGNASVNVNMSAETGTWTSVEVWYAYVDKDVTIKADKVSEKEDDYEITQNAVNLSLKQGWNAITVKDVYAETATKVTITVSITKGDTGRWILGGLYDDDDAWSVQGPRPSITRPSQTRPQIRQLLQK